MRLRIKAAGERFLEEVVNAIEAEIGESKDWYDQTTSPLGKRKHLELVREKVLPGHKEGNRVLVRRADVDAYLMRKGERPSGIREVDQPDDEDNDDKAVAQIITGLGLVMAEGGASKRRRYG